MTNLEMRRLAASLDLRAIREACGYSGIALARAMGLPQTKISAYERGEIPPQGSAGARYMRVILGMRNHLEAADGDAAWPGLERAA